VERIAARAGVAKSTIYRPLGQPGRPAGRTSWARCGTRDTGARYRRSLADLRALAGYVVASLRVPAIQAAFGRMIAAAAENPAAREVFVGFPDSAGLPACRSSCRRAVDRGEIPSGTDPAQVLSIVTAVIYYRLYVVGGCNQVTCGARPSPISPPRRPPRRRGQASRWPFGIGQTVVALVEPEGLKAAHHGYPTTHSGSLVLRAPSERDAPTIARAGL